MDTAIATARHALDQGLFELRRAGAPDWTGKPAQMWRERLAELARRAHDDAQDFDDATRRLRTAARP